MHSPQTNGYPSQPINTGASPYYPPSPAQNIPHSYSSTAPPMSPRTPHLHPSKSSYNMNYSYNNNNSNHSTQASPLRPSYLSNPPPSYSGPLSSTSNRRHDDDLTTSDSESERPRRSRRKEREVEPGTRIDMEMAESTEGRRVTMWGGRRLGRCWVWVVWRLCWMGWVGFRGDWVWVLIMMEWDTCIYVESNSTSFQSTKVGVCVCVCVCVCVYPEVIAARESEREVKREHTAHKSPSHFKSPTACILSFNLSVDHSLT